MITIILMVSIILQIISLYLFLRLIKVAKGSTTWLIFASALFLIAIRRILALYNVALYPEIISLVVSILILLGIIKITPYILTALKTTKDAYKEKDELKTYLDLAGIIFVVIDINQKVKMINKKGCEILGRKDKNEIIGKNWFDNFLPERFRKNVKEVFYNLISGKVEAIEFYENPILTSSGKEKVISWHNTLLEDENGNLIGILSAGEDITERIKMEDKIRKSEEKFRMLADESPNMIFINYKGKVVYTNTKCEEITGYSKEEFYSPDFNFLQLIAPESLARVKEHYSKHLSGKDIAPYDYTLLTKDGTKIEAIITTKLIDYENDKAILGIVTDITKRKQLEKDLFESEKRYRHLIELCPDAIAVHLEGKVVFVNAAGVKILGARTQEELTGKPIFEFVHPDYWQKVKERIQKMLIQGQNAPLIEEKFIRLDGSVIDIEIAASPITYHGKQAVQVVIRDISERKKAEELSKQNQLKFESLFNHLPDAIYLENLDGKILDCNLSAEKTTGYSKKELLRMSAKDLVPHETLAAFPSFINELIEKGSCFTENLNIRKNGELFPVEVYMKLIEINKEKLLFVLTRDISERRKIEVEALKIQEKYKELVNSIPEVIFETDNNGIITFTNSAGYRLFGYTEDDIKNDINIFSLIPPRDRGKAKINFDKILSNKEKDNFDKYNAIRKNGDIFPINVYSHPVIDEKNNIKGISGIIIDMTELDKLESLKKDFIAFFSHEARNPLSTLKESISIIDEEISEDITNEQKNTLSIAKNNIERLFTLINNFLDFSVLENKTSNFIPSQFDIQPVIEDVLEDFKQKITDKKINVQINSKDPYFVFADTYRVHEIISNLISNAIKFSKEKGNILIDISDIDEFIQISIKDNGIGIKNKDFKNIFKKFTKTNIPYSIKPEGIGLGLTITKQLVELMGGKIWVESESGNGAKFTFTLPKPSLR